MFVCVLVVVLASNRGAVVVAFVTAKSFVRALRMFF